MLRKTRGAHYLPDRESSRRQRPRLNAVIDLTSSSDEEKKVDEEMPLWGSKGQPPLEEGVLRWQSDVAKLKNVWKNGEVEGYGGLIATVRDFDRIGRDQAVQFKLHYEDMDGREAALTFAIQFGVLANYPHTYTSQARVEQTVRVPRRVDRSLPRFTEIFDLELKDLVLRLVMALQGDDDADGGKPTDVVPDETEWEEHGLVLEEQRDLPMEVSTANTSMDWEVLRQHFEQGKAMGYRPGLTNVSDHWVISYSIPFKSIPIDPNTLRIWDDGLVEASQQNQRFTLLIVVDQYPAHIDKMKFFIGAGPHYKPSAATIDATTRSTKSGGGKLADPLKTFFLSGPLSDYLKSFGRCYKLRTAFDLNWHDADTIGMDEDRSRQVFQDNVHPAASGHFDQKDPVVMGFEHNISLVAFWWTLRRFQEAPKFCLNCGLGVAIPSLRPYVCDKQLCLYGYMSLGLGPSVEHVIRTQPLVVDLLLSFAFLAAKSATRMDMPLGLHIELPDGSLLDNATDKANALADLLDEIPSVKKIKKKLDQGVRLKDVGASPGAITVLRWVIGSCRAYLKETSPGEGVIRDVESQASSSMYRYHGHSYGPIRQFSFVVGSPEQEDNFKTEIAEARKSSKNCEKYPTILAFHGSSCERWHNILRTGLDYNEMVCGRVSNNGLIMAVLTLQAYGNGVYFAPDARTSMSHYARPANHTRNNADLAILTATALVELVNVPNSFVCKQPYYVVNNVKQLKPFLLLVTSAFEGEKSAEDGRVVAPKGKLFEHDPSLPIATTFDGGPIKVSMPDQLEATPFVDNEPDDTVDADILRPTPVKPVFKPSSASRMRKLQVMPPPIETSTVATRTLQKEFKNLIKLQEENSLPFYIDSDTESLYCWVLELFEFPASKLKDEMKQHEVNSIITEIRFPASFPHSPPFMRILHPRFLPFMSGGGGNITAGGSICNEILTATGWNPAYTVEAMVRDIMTNMTEASPPARLDPHGWDSGYTLDEAIEAFKRVANAHNWQIPKDFDKMTR